MDKAKKAANAERAFTREMFRRHGDLSDNQLGYLLAEAETQIDWTSYVAGIEALDVDSLCAGVERSETGKIVLPAADKAEETAPDVEAETAGMTRAQRINYARARNLG